MKKLPSPIYKLEFTKTSRKAVTGWRKIHITHLCHTRITRTAKQIQAHGFRRDGLCKNISKYMHACECASGYKLAYYWHKGNLSLELFQYLFTFCLSAIQPVCYQLFSGCYVRFCSCLDLQIKPLLRSECSSCNSYVHLQIANVLSTMKQYVVLFVLNSATRRCKCARTDLSW